MNLTKLLLFLFVTLLLTGCASVGVLLSTVVTSPKLLVYTTHKSYDQNIEVDISINEKPHKIKATIRCIKDGVQSPNAATMSWKEKWSMVLLNNELIDGKEKYKMVLGSFDSKGKIYHNLDRIIYGYSDRSWCGDFLRDFKAIEKVNKNNALVLMSNNDGFINDSRGFLYIVKEDDKNSNMKQNRSKSNSPQTVIIKNFKILNQLK